MALQRGSSLASMKVVESWCFPAGSLTWKVAWVSFAFVPTEWVLPAISSLAAAMGRSLPLPPLGPVGQPSVRVFFDSFGQRRSSIS